MFHGPVMIFTGGWRATDDGVKVAATNSMAVMAGVEGRYNRGTYQYPPPAMYRNWSSVVRQKKLRMTMHNLYIFDGGD